MPMVNKNQLKTYLPLIFSLLLGLVLFFLVDDFVREVLIKPILWLVWFLSLLIRSIPQGIFWVGLIVFMLVITLSSLMGRREADPRPRRHSTRKLGTVEKWARLLEFSRTSSYSKWRLSQRLRRLSQRILSPYNDRNQFSKRLPDFEPPEEIRLYFGAQQPSGYSIVERFNPGATSSNSDLDLDPEVVIQYLEKSLDGDRFNHQ